MARKRNQEDVFKPLNDSPAAETEEPESSGRGLEIKIGLMVLVLFVGAVGYFAYLKLSPVDETTEIAAGASGPEIDAGKTAANRVVSAHGVTEVEPELGSDGQALVMAQFNDVSSSETRGEADAWVPSQAAVTPAPQTLEADTNQAYAANYSGDTVPAPPASNETTFAPMPNPSDFTTGTATPLPSVPATLADPGLPPVNSSPNQVAATDPVSAMPDTIPGQAAETIAPVTNGQYPTSSARLQPPADAYDLQTASKPDYAPVTSPLPSGAPVASANPAPSNSYAQAAPGHAAPSEPYASSSTASDRGTYPVPATEPVPYGAPAATTAPAQKAYESYAPATKPRTQAGYAGLSGSDTTTSSRIATESWQKPTVVPVDGNYTARPNDNFYTISRKVYGSGAYFEALAEFNADKYPTASRIRIGDVVKAPPVETLESRYPELCPKPEHRDAAKRRSEAMAGRSLAGRRVYVVQEGDNLFDIARFELGARSKVADLIEMNQDVLGNQINYLTPGMRLVLPETNNGGPKVTRRPTNSLR